MIKQRKKTYFLPGLLIFILLLAGCHVTQSPKSATGFYFNTVITVTIYDHPSEKLLNGCMELASHYEQLFSRTLEGSDIWRINHSGGSYVTVDSETLSLLNTALTYSRLSDGLVDPTIGSLSALWNFGEENQGNVPSDLAIQQALSHVNYRNILISGNQVALSDPDACIDLGFIAKGYIADRIKEYLVSEGIHSGIINLGGNVLAIGSRPSGESFQIGIQKPFDQTGAIVSSLSLTDKSMVSSGNYERYFEKDGTLYHHILSTSTGYPAKSGLSQVTIISSQSVDGDALSTLCFILGYEKGLEFIEGLENVDAVFITTDGTIYQTF